MNSHKGVVSGMSGSWGTQLIGLNTMIAVQVSAGQQRPMAVIAVATKWPRAIGKPFSYFNTKRNLKFAEEMDGAIDNENQQWESPSERAPWD
jgi:hypothetical protein